MLVILFQIEDDILMMLSLLLTIPSYSLLFTIITSLSLSVCSLHTAITPEKVYKIIARLFIIHIEADATCFA